MEKNKRLKVLVLSGGGAHTTTYPGIWEIIHDRIHPDSHTIDEDYIPDYIIGTSGGALFGCLMAVKRKGKFLSGNAIKNKFKEQQPWELARVPAPGEGINFLTKWGLIDINTIIDKLKKILGEYHISWESLDKPQFQCVVADLSAGRRRYVKKDSGISLATAVGASIAIPGVFTPVWSYIENIDKKHCFVDGGTCEGLPIRATLGLHPEQAKEKLKILMVSPFKTILDDCHKLDNGREGTDDERYDITEMKDYMQALYRTLLDSKTSDMCQLLNYTEVDNVRVFTDSHATRAMDFSPETIEANYQLGRDAAYKKIEEIDAFFKEP